ncbi:hypothetical protein PRABACTJOHN_03690 [Parabacteroides johnsonii DSM 18315]|uniref:Uncharacterized protein n=1 Tax=Parabacteroides johnsonii DSM 18315 TaxID=537006 RepID=B7BF61_9BACT|nr:hypothetical protein PRABACTJOHN_03690 [Parabacteroides johnsonii DSM 18315]
METILSIFQIRIFSNRIIGNPCRLNFLMQRYSGYPVVKYRYANGSRIFTAAFRKS